MPNCDNGCGKSRVFWELQGVQRSKIEAMKAEGKEEASMYRRLGMIQMGITKIIKMNYAPNIEQWPTFLND